MNVSVRVTQVKKDSCMRKVMISMLLLFVFASLIGCMAMMHGI